MSHMDIVFHIHISMTQHVDELLHMFDKNDISYTDIINIIICFSNVQNAIRIDIYDRDICPVLCIKNIKINAGHNTSILCFWLFPFKAYNEIRILMTV